MKIVHLVSGGDFAGGQTIALRIAEAAGQRGDEAVFVAPEPGPFVDRVLANGMSAYVLPLRRTYRVDNGVRLARLLRRERADALHTHTLVAGNVLGRAAARIAGVPVISHLHIENHFRPLTRPALELLDNASARLCSRHVAVSETTRRAYERQGYPRERIEVVLNGVELNGSGTTFDLRSEFGIPRESLLVGEVARLCEVKGQRELIEAMASVSGAWLVLVGADLELGGAFQEELERHAVRLGVRERVVFAGRRDDAAELLGQLDVVALPSWVEGLPLVLLEAMARHRAVVATPVGGTPELVVEGETGVLVPPRDPAALARAIQGLLADPHLRARLGDAGHRRVAQRFDAAAMCRRVLELYDEVVTA